jgi:Ca2+-binding EF-hand superfamily protein
MFFLSSLSRSPRHHWFTSQFGTMLKNTDYSVTVWLLALFGAMAATMVHGHDHAHEHQHSHFSTAAAPSRSGGSIYLMLMVHDHCKFTVENVQRSIAKPNPFVPIDPEIHPIHLHLWNESHGIDLSDHGMINVNPEARHLRYLITYVNASGWELGHLFPDPRLRVADGIHGSHPVDLEDLYHKKNKNEEPTKMQFFLHPEPDGEPIWVPEEAKEVRLYCRNMSAFTTYPLTAIPSVHDGFQTQADYDVRVSHIQDTGPIESQPNFIFLAGGYTQAEEAAFNSTIRRIVGLLEDKQTSSGGYATPVVDPDIANMHRSVAVNRYWSTYNVFQVYQVSPQSGSSYPGRSITVNDNLGCYHPATTERAVSCSIAKVQNLAAKSPANSINYPDKAIIIVIVNTKTYGGTGIFRRGRLHICHFFSGYENPPTGSPPLTPPVMYPDSKYASLINHEAGHAFGNLFDEYDIGISEPTSMWLLNCQASRNGGPPTPPQWQNWITLLSNPTSKTTYQNGITDNNWGILTTPTAICGFSNYYKSNNFCMMNHITDFFMCPVCRENSTVEEMNVGMSYQWPRFPLPDPVLVLPDDPSNTLTTYNTKQTGVMFHLPNLLSSSNGFTVTWRDDAGVSLNSYQVNTVDCPQCLLVSSTLLSNYDSRQGSIITFFVNVTDNTVFINPSTAPRISNLRQQFRFRLKVVPVAQVSTLPNISTKPPIITQGANFGRSNLDLKQTYQQCLSIPGEGAPLCALNFSAKTFESASALDEQLAQYDQWVLYVVGGIAALFLLLWIFAANYYSSKSKNVVRPIFRTNFSGCVNVVRKIMLASAVLFMLASLGTMGFSVWVYTQVSAIGKIIVLAGMILATGLYIMAFIGFWAVSYRSKKLVLVNGGILIFGFLILGGIAVVGVMIGQTINDDNSFWTRQLESLWKLIVRDAPENACAIQGMLQCTGFFVSCISNVESTVYCPQFCESTNARYATSCQKTLQDYINANYLYALTIIFGAVGLMIMAIIFNYYYYFSLRKLKNEIRSQYNKRVQKVASQKGMSGAAVDKSKALFILKTLDDGDTKHLIREFRRIDVDGNGELDRQEFLMFFKKALCYKPSPIEIDEIFRVADLDGSGTISLEEFLCIFNPEAISQVGQVTRELSRKQSSKKMNEMALVRKALTDDRKNEILRRAHNTYGDLTGRQVELRQAPSASPSHTGPTSPRNSAPLPTQSGNPYGPRGQQVQVREDLL